MGKAGEGGTADEVSRGGIHWFLPTFCSKKVRANAIMRGQVIKSLWYKVFKRTNAQFYILIKKACRGAGFARMRIYTLWVSALHAVS